MVRTLDLMNHMFQIIGAVFIALLAVKVMYVVVSLVLVLPHCLHGREPLVAQLERAWYGVRLGSHVD